MSPTSPMSLNQSSMLLQPIVLEKEGGRGGVERRVKMLEEP